MMPFLILSFIEQDVMLYTEMTFAFCETIKVMDTPVVELTSQQNQVNVQSMTYLIIFGCKYSITFLDLKGLEFLTIICKDYSI